VVGLKTYQHPCIELSAKQTTVTMTRVVYVATVASRRHIAAPTPWTFFRLNMLKC